MAALQIKVKKLRSLTMGGRENDGSLEMALVEQQFEDQPIRRYEALVSSSDDKRAVESREELRDGTTKLNHPLVRHY